MDQRGFGYGVQCVVRWRVYSHIKRDFFYSSFVCFMEQTWEMVVEPKHPIAVSELELTVTQGRNLEIPFERAALIDEINDYWNSFGYIGYLTSF